MNISIDLETFSSVDIQKCGLYKYVQSADFEILLFAYAIDDGEVNIIDLACGDHIPQEIIKMLFDRHIVKRAYNAAFEWLCLCKHFNVDLPFGWLAQWQCTMHLGLYRGYPAGLGAIGSALRLPESKRKLSTGKALIKKFCVPCEPTSKNGNRTRNLPQHEPEQWALFKAYCKQDVETERTVFSQLSSYDIPAQENYLWQLDQYINHTGVSLDTDLIEGAIAIHSQIADELILEAQGITGLANPNSTPQLLTWLNGQGVSAADLKKETVKDILEQEELSPVVRRVLEIRQELSKTSIKKYHTMLKMMCQDGRTRGLLQFYGANRTGRWAGRGIQVHNLPRNYIGTLDTARAIVKTHNAQAVKLIYGNATDTISQLIRTAFVPESGKRFHVADFSAIEARVLSWLADEQWRLDVFNTHGKIYEASAAAMFSVPLEHIVKGRPEYDLRQKGKVAELALGYQGSASALIAMGALKSGLTEVDLPDIVSRWRESNKRIVGYWYTIGNAAVECVKYGTTAYLKHGITISRDPSNLIITLPSGRQLFYVDPFIAPNQWGKDSVLYYGVDDKGKWGAISTYGGKLTENITQAVARDCLAHCMIKMYEAGYKIVMHVHDEVVVESDKDCLNDLVRIMRIPAPWAEGLPLNADGFSGSYYQK